MQAFRLCCPVRTPPRKVSSRWCLSKSMWLRRMKAGSATHCPPRAASMTGCGTRVPAVAGAAALAATRPAKGSSTQATAKRIRVHQDKADKRGIGLVPKTHLDVAGGAHIGTDVATNAFAVVGVHITPYG